MKSIAETKLHPSILFDNETVTASYDFVAEVSLLDDLSYPLDDRVYPAAAEVQFQWWKPLG